MDDIARELGMSKKTLYHFIKDKNELVESVVDYNMQLFVDLISVFHDPEYNAIEQHFIYKNKIKEHFPKYNPSLLYDLRKYYPLLLNKYNDQKLRLVYEANIANLEKGKKEGYFQSDINSEIISKLQVGIQHLIFDSSNEIYTDAELMDINTIEQLYKYHFRGICTSEGLDEIQRLLRTNKTDKTR